VLLPQRDGVQLRDGVLSRRQSVGPLLDPLVFVSPHLPGHERRVGDWATHRHSILRIVLVYRLSLAAAAAASPVLGIVVVITLVTWTHWYSWRRHRGQLAPPDRFTEHACSPLGD
jgi:hypothetical protein